MTKLKQLFLNQYRSDGFRKNIGSSSIGEDKLKKLAEKFVTYFGGTFQCNVGHQVIRIKRDSNGELLLFKVFYLHISFIRNKFRCIGFFLY